MLVALDSPVDAPFNTVVTFNSRTSSFIVNAASVSFVAAVLLGRKPGFAGELWAGSVARFCRLPGPASLRRCRGLQNLHRRCRRPLSSLWRLQGALKLKAVLVLDSVCC
mmetsp:Transcript_5951/g.17916  ORF Transcript_5951/g.17916 Transcript_5951/m.17916 type:complete len:109 (+) Transcript_5951:532-858(+)